MKNIKELKQSIAPRMRRCWGESCAMFVISAGGICAAVFAWYLTMNFLIAVNVIESASDGIMLAVTAVIVLIMWVIAVPYKYGSRWYRLQQVRGHSVHAKSIFSCYFSLKRMVQVYKLSAAVILKKALLLIPFAALIFASVYLITRFDASGNGFLYNLAVVILLMLSVAVYLAYLMASLKYAAVSYLFALGHDRPIGDIIQESRRFMKDKNSYMAEVLRSLAFMLIPCILVFPMFFVLPRVKMLYTAAINEIIEDGFERDKLMSMERGEKFASR